MSDEKIQTFLDELTALSHKHGLGIGDVVLYELEAEDAERSYRCDNDSRLTFE